MSDDMYRIVHEELVDKLLETNPEIGWETAYELTAEAAREEYVERWAAMIDYQRMSREL